MQLPAHLATCAGLAPTTRSSGSSIRGEPPSRRGNKAAQTSLLPLRIHTLTSPAPRTHYDKKINQDKHHTQALPCPCPTHSRRPLRHAPRQHLYKPQPAPSP
ncbi:transposase [Streptomyces sp. NPDC088748]|uniref:transposase n=1 Tax=Streptomyces sp. NPDC088748 TaxID=3365887 RepID=UPI0037F858E7